MTRDLSLWKDRRFQTILLLFVIFAVWRGALFLHPDGEQFNPWSFAWGATYQILAFLGALVGFFSAAKWGGWGSTFGKMTLFFSIGLILQSVGQAISSYYVYTTGEIPYPGLGDIGFFGSAVFYILGAVFLSRIIGIRAFFRSPVNKATAILLPAALVGGSYLLFLNGHEYDWSHRLQGFLDFGYPIFQAVFVAMAVLSLVVAKKYLGGMMRMPVLVLLFALVMQYLSDFVFLYQASRGLYIPEGVNDCMYFVSYFLMAWALIYVGNVFKKITHS